MDYQEALDYVLSFSDYERWPGAGYAERWDLRRMDELLRQAGSPHLNRKTVHIAGSKGKGSTAAMIASALSTAGFRTGLYTSPHLHTMRERMRINGQLITEQEFAETAATLKPHIEKTNRIGYGELSTFEILTAMAFLFFQEKGADFQVLEVGLGGRLDATNVIQSPDVCVITSISLDHTAVLGDSIDQIATEKAGIIKPGCTVVSAPQARQAANVIRTVSTQKRAELIEVGVDVLWEGKEIAKGSQMLEVKTKTSSYDLKIPFLGEYQLENAATAVASLEVIGIERDHIISGLANTQWEGRLEILQDSPLMIVDGAHNSDSARRLLEAIKKHFEFNRAILIIGTSADKGSDGIIAELAFFFDHVFVTKTQHPRATDAEKLAGIFSQYGIQSHKMENVAQALSEALSCAAPDDLICATGSLFLVAEVVEEVKGIKGERYPVDK